MSGTKARATPAKYVAPSLALAAIALRFVSLPAMPIFGDEAIYLRLARIVRAAPFEHLWVPLQIPNAPLHVWFLALSLPFSDDPVLAGRILSVVLGSLLVAAVAGAADVLGRTFGARGDELLLAPSLAVVTPFLVFSDRIARPDTLFALETVLAAALSLAMAIRLRPLGAAIPFGVLMGATMLSRQAVSYPLWLLPLIAWACAGRRDWRRLVLPFGLALLIALAIWGPMLVAPGWPGLGDRVFHLGATRPALPAGGRALLVARNLGTVAAAFWTYLTPPVFLAAGAGLVYLAWKRRRLFAFIAAWIAIVLLPPVVFAGDYFPRYAVPAAPPLLVSAAILVAFAWRRAGRAARIAVASALLAWPAITVARGLRQWTDWPFLSIDREQFVSGWSAGSASEAAASFLGARARAGVAVVVPHVSGNPSDAIWLRLDGRPDVRLFYAEDFLRLPAERVKGDVWTGEPRETLPPHGPVFFVSPDPVFLGWEGWAPVATVVPARNSSARAVAHFENPPGARGGVESAVVVYRLR